MLKTSAEWQHLKLSNEKKNTVWQIGSGNMAYYGGKTAMKTITWKLYYLQYHQLSTISYLYSVQRMEATNLALRWTIWMSLKCLDGHSTLTPPHMISGNPRAYNAMWPGGAVNNRNCFVTYHTRIITTIHQSTHSGAQHIRKKRWQEWNWSDKEVKELLAVRAEEEMFLQISDADAAI